MTALTIERGAGRSEVPQRINDLINDRIGEKIRRTRSGEISAGKVTFTVTTGTDKDGEVKCAVTFSEGETRKAEWYPAIQQMTLPMDTEE